FADPARQRADALALVYRSDRGVERTGRGTASPEDATRQVPGRTRPRRCALSRDRPRIHGAMITELHILPAFAIARLGSSPEPMVNYEADVNPPDPLGVRRLIGAPTFIVEPGSGAIRECIDRPEVKFRDP